jgi:hypothetical protein
MWKNQMQMLHPLSEPSEMMLKEKISYNGASSSDNRGQWAWVFIFNVLTLDWKRVKRYVIGASSILHKLYAELLHLMEFEVRAMAGKWLVQNWMFSLKFKF